MVVIETLFLSSNLVFHLKVDLHCKTNIKTDWNYCFTEHKVQFWDLSGLKKNVKDSKWLEPELRPEFTWVSQNMLREFSRLYHQFEGRWSRGTDPLWTFFFTNSLWYDFVIFCSIFYKKNRIFTTLSCQMLHLLYIRKLHHSDD